MDQLLIATIVRWLPVVLGGLIALYGLSVIRLITPLSSERITGALPLASFGISFTVGLAAIPACGLLVRAEPGGWWIGLAWLWGTLVALATLTLIFCIGSLGSLSGIEAPPLLATGGFLGGLALGLLALALPWAIAHSGNLLVACAGGLCVPFLLYRSSLSNSNQAQSEAASLSFDVAGVFAFLLVGALLIGQQRFEKNIQGSTFPLLMAAATLSIALLYPWLISRRPRPVVSLLLLTLIAIAIEAFAAHHLLNDWMPLACLGLGHLMGFLLLLTAIAFPANTMRGNAVMVAILAAGAALAFRFMAAYGIALTAVGLIPLLVVVFALASLRESFGPSLLRGVSALTSLIFFRVLVEEMSLSRSVNLSDPYPFFGIIAGALLPFLLAPPLQTASLPRLVIISLLAATLPALMGLFWKIEGNAGLLMGLGLAQFLILFFPDLSFSRATASFLVWPAALSSLRLTPPVAAYAVEMTRSLKSGILLGLSIAAILIFVIASLIIHRRSARSPLL